MLEQSLSGLVGVEVPGRAFRDNGLGLLLDRGGELLELGLEELPPGVGHQTLLRIEARQLIDQMGFRQLLHEEVACGHVHPAETRVVLDPQADCTEEIVFLGLQEHVICECARCDNTYDIPLDHALGSLGVFNLLTHGNLEACLNHFLEISVHRVKGHAGQGNGAVVRFASAGQGEPQDARAGLGVVVECFVKITHPEEQDGVRVFFLEMEKLLHRRRYLVRFLDHGEKIIHKAWGTTTFNQISWFEMPCLPKLGEKRRFSSFWFILVVSWSILLGLPGSHYILYTA